MPSKKETTPPLPSKGEIVSFIEQSDIPVGKREIGRAFNLRAGDRSALRALLRELLEEGAIERHRGGRYGKAGGLPEVLVVQVSEIDADGEVIARPVRWGREGPPPRIYIAPESKGRRALGAGERALVRLRPIDGKSYEGRTIRVLRGAPQQILGIYETGERGGRLRPTDKRIKTEFAIRPEDAGGARSGELVLTELMTAPHLHGARQVGVIERLGDVGDTRSLSLIAIHEHGIPTQFSDRSLAQAEAAGPAPLADREDLRALPLVTIDGADARDFDDAVWAAPDDDPKNRGGWQILVAIADVAHYVPAGSALDKDAYERGNSVYLPDRVVPMLPEALSNGWCSLRPDEERPCFAARLWLDKEGRLKRHVFRRGLMRSAARLTYAAVQAARDGRPDKTTKPLLKTVIEPLYGAYAALAAAREARGTLDLDLPERQILFDDKGALAGIKTRQRLDSHRLIEEFMITANVAAAEALEAKKAPCMYRVHDAPDPQKVEALREMLATMGVRLARGQVVRPALFAQVLKRLAGTPFAAMGHDLILRTQSQAVYAPNNIGHFGLALRRYAHFTSPIRRYADLLVHRALITALEPGPAALPAETAAAFDAIGQHISTTERRAQAAERDCYDRFAAAFLRDQVGKILTGRVTSVTRFGLFVALDDSLADALVPVSTLPDDRYRHDTKQHCLVGQRWGRSYHLGETVAGRLMEADPVTGGLVLALLDEEPEAGAAGGSQEPAEDSVGSWHPLAAIRRGPAGGDAAGRRRGRAEKRRKGGRKGR